METVGYVCINHNAVTGRTHGDISSFKGKICRVLEFLVDGSVLILNDEANAIATFDKEDIDRSFECEMFQGVVCAPGQTFMEKLKYWNRCHHRKGGYGEILKQMVVLHSLHKGEFDDRLLWSKQ